MKTNLLLVFLVNSLISYSQDYVLEKVQLTETVDSIYVSEIPRLMDASNESNPVVDIINSQILDRFMINGFEQSELEEFRWYEVSCSSEINENILYISFAGEYYGAYPNYVNEELFFDLKTGEPLKINIIPFQALFTLQGYLDFLNLYWLEGVKNEFVSAIECAEYEPYCSYYDINFNYGEDNKLSISLTDDCYAHVSQACSPFYEISIELDSIEQYLNELGKYILIESNYKNMTTIEKFQANKRLWEKIPNNFFLFGEIDDKYPFSMAINIDKQNEVSGYYYYDKKLQKISLKGQNRDNTMFLTETVNTKQTGFFELDINIDNYPIDGKWLNPEKTKNLSVKFTKILTCDGN